jgi:diguanylate cyclase (GGDEF)-like protein
MEQPLRVLIVDDHAPDAELSARQIAAGGYRCVWRRVETESDFRVELRQFAPHLILSDFTLPQYDGLSALDLANHEAPGTPFIFVSGSIGEARAAQALTEGAADYVPKGERTRLVPAVTRALSLALSDCGPSGTPAERVRRIGGALQILSGMRAAALTLHSRTELLEEACRIVQRSQRYEYCFIVLLNPHTHTAHTVAWSGTGAERGSNGRFVVGADDGEDSSMVSRVLRTGQPTLCLDIDEYRGAFSELERAAASRGGPLLSLPLRSAVNTIGAITLGLPRHAHISEQELLLLEELATQVSNALHALPNESTERHLPAPDPLTGLPQREFFCEHFTQRLAECVANGSPPTIAVFDVERLRDINDAHGRHIGDRLLLSIAERLKRRFGGEDLAHFGGGTFAAAFADRRTAAIERDAGTAVFGHPFVIGTQPFTVTVKCELAYYPLNGRDAETLLQHAEAQLGKVRERTLTDHTSSAESIKSGSARKLRQQPLAGEHAIESRRLQDLRPRLRLALKQQQFHLNYQPIAESRSRRIVAVEALLRWDDPQHGVIPPGVFLPALENTDLIVPIGEWVLSQTARDCARWRQIGLPPIRVAVNVTPTELTSKDFAAHFLGTLRRSHLSGGVDIEITESALIGDAEGLRETLDALRAEGVNIAIDDFGMGYSSLSRLMELPVDTLKIDRAFTDHLSHQAQSQAVIAAIIALAKAYSLHTIAEGVETEDQLKILDALGCEQTQGYFLCPPLCAEELELLLGSGAKAPDSAGRLCGALCEGMIVRPR